MGGEREAGGEGGGGDGGEGSFVGGPEEEWLTEGVDNGFELEVFSVTEFTGGVLDLIELGVRDPVVGVGARDDADAVYIGSSYARGNENNQHQPDGVHYLGPGSTGGYAVANLGAEFRPIENLKLFVQVNNVLDRQYSSASQLGATGFNATGAFVARPFPTPVIDGERALLQSTYYAPGAPRSYWVGVRYLFPGK